MSCKTPTYVTNASQTVIYDVFSIYEQKYAKNRQISKLYFQYYQISFIKYPDEAVGRWNIDQLSTFQLQVYCVIISTALFLQQSQVENIEIKNS